MERRFADNARIIYHDATLPETREGFASLLEEIEKRGLLFPVTVINGVPVYDGAVSYPSILRAVNDKLLDRERANA